MLDFFNIQLPTGVNYQEFYGGGTQKDWVKPRGAAMTMILLIGAGAGGRTGSTGTAGQGGGSGAIVRWIGPAIFVPDILTVSIGVGGAADSAGTDTTLTYQSYTLLTATGGASGTGGAAMTNNYFGASGIFLSLAGATGAVAGVSFTATTRFLGGGGGGASSATTSGGAASGIYGYTAAGGTPSTGGGTSGGQGGDGLFFTEPVLVGTRGGGGGGGSSAAGGSGIGGAGGRGGIGCGGGGGARGSNAGGAGGRGGDGAAFIWSW